MGNPRFTVLSQEGRKAIAVVPELPNRWLPSFDGRSRNELARILMGKGTALV